MKLRLLIGLAALSLAQPALAAPAKKSAEERAAEAAGAAAAAGGDAERQINAIRVLDDDPEGPMLNAVIVYNPNAAEEAEDKASTGLLGGRTVLIKDNIETKDFPTTGGSLALEGNITGRDAPVVARVRAEGGVILGKTNLSEWANIRGSRSSSGWSGVGGQTRNPHALDRTPCGSSSGSGAAVAAGKD